MKPKILDYLPKILAFVPYIPDFSRNCPCDSGLPYGKCCWKALRSGKYNQQMAAYDEVFPHRGRRTYYLYTPQEGDISC